MTPTADAPAELTFTDSAAFDIPAGAVNTAITSFSVARGVSGGTAPYTFSKESGPEWLTVADDGTITGTRPAAAAAATTAVIKVTDSATPTVAPATKTITIAIGAVATQPAAAGTVTANKTDAHGNPLADATLTLTSNAPGQVPLTAVTDASGVAKFENVPDGSYALAETQAPDGYALSTEQYIVYVRNGEVTYQNMQQQMLNTPPTFVNTLAGNSFEVNKTDGSRNPLGGAVFQLVSATVPVKTYTATSNAQGVATFLNVDIGNYTLSEKTAPSGYTKSNDQYKLQVISTNPGYLVQNDNGVGMNPTAYTPVTFVNTRTSSGSNDGGSPTTARIPVKKTDATGTALSGAVFVLTNANGKEAYTATSDANGMAYFSNVASGSYTLSEKTAPSGYVKSDKTYAIRTSGSSVYLESNVPGQAGQSYTTVTYVNNKSAELNKVDHNAFMQGYPNGTFGLERNMTRGEVATMFARLLTEQMEIGKTYSNTFTDVAASCWCVNEIGYMQQYAIISGYTDGTFRPDAPITRAEFAAIACRFEKLTAGTATFSDVPTSHWAAKYINFAATRGWVTGYKDGTFKPENKITRAEVVAVTCRLLERSADQNYVNTHYSTLPRTFSDVNKADWAFWYVMEAANGHDYTKSGSTETWTQVRK